jgi:GT2 family glycosyltransferase
MNLKCLLEWFAITASINEQIELIIIEYSPQPSLDPESIPNKNVRYIYIAGDGVFNKSRLLNIGLKESRGEIVLGYDVDLVPVDLSFKLPLTLAQKSDDLLVSGYRLNYSEEYLSPSDILTAKYRSSIPRDCFLESFMRMQLVDGQRYGVLPLFIRQRLIEIGGWDERFEGWGGEDQDLIERYLGKSKYLMRCPDLIYIHLAHGGARGWNEPQLTLKNNSLYYSKRKMRGVEK